MSAGALLRAETNWLDAAKAARQLPTETFFSLPEIRQPRLSPDGSMIGFLFPHEGKMALGVFDRATKEASMVEKRQGHGFRDEDASVGFYGRMEPFLAKYLTPEVDVQIGFSEVVELPL